MTILAYFLIRGVIFGVIQGITEFLPISSSGHLVILENIFGFPAATLGAFDIFLHLGTLVALVFYFRKEIVQMFKELVNWREWKNSLLLKLFLASVPAGVVGILFKDWIENNIRETFVVGVLFVATGFLFLAAERWPKQKNIKTIRFKDILAMGLFQVAGILPGISRSGSVICGGLFSGVERSVAARFSFLMALPAIFGAAVFQLTDLLNDQSLRYDIFSIWPFYAAGFLASLISSLWAVRAVLRFFARCRLNIFAYYLLVIGALMIIWKLWFIS
ncbi:MAG: undecaprenyl-diphosphate phosphatase [Patescibacteria group bacterium]|nr:undecaprenyl-diphosphate phosphatase [Patescibacteria group bacterium]MDD5490790.1 undecaprenyl-diphosphate phosphatase [Patescibacteria group bacterium]